MLKKFSDGDRPKGKCYDCLRPYTDFRDMVIPDELWEKINPTYHEGAGILCPTCIISRLDTLSPGEVSVTIHFNKD